MKHNSTSMTRLNVLACAILMTTTIAAPTPVKAEPLTLGAALAIVGGAGLITAVAHSQPRHYVYAPPVAIYQPAMVYTSVPTVYARPAVVYQPVATVTPYYTYAQPVMPAAYAPQMVYQVQ